MSTQISIAAATQPMAPPQPQAQSTYLLPKLRTLYTGSLNKTLSKCSYPAFAACFPTPAAKKTDVLKTVHKQIVEKVESKAMAEFEVICQERDLDASLGELERVIDEAKARSRVGERGGHVLAGGRLHTLPPRDLLLATLAPRLDPVAKEIEGQIDEQHRRNEVLVGELLRKRNEVLGVVKMLEDVVKDMEDANGVLYAATKEMNNVPAG